MGAADRPYRVPAPAAADRIAWPASFGTRFTVSVDVEEEFDWRAPFHRTAHSTEAMKAFADGHRRFADRGVGLTCMVDYPVVRDPAAVDILARAMEDGRSAIGAQLHPWVNPPFDELLCPRNSYAGNLAPPLEAAKIDMLTDAIATAFGERPVAYRAGRYGIGPATIGLLVARGYRVDSSVRAGYDYGADGGPDFTAVDSHAYRTGGLIELPLTTVFTGIARRGGARLHRALGRVPRGRGVFARTGLLSRVALTPEDMPLAEAIEAVDVAIGEGVRLLNFAFHSPSLAPGHTPYVRDAADLRAFHRWWAAMFDHLERRGIVPVTLAGIMDAAG